MPGGLAVQMAGFRQLLNRKIIACQVEPTIKEHRAVTGRQNKTITVQPPGIRRVESQRMPKKHGPDLGGSKRETQVSGVAGGNDTIDGNSASLIGRLQEKFFVQRHITLIKPTCPTGSKSGKTGSLLIIVHANAGFEL
jgi:hypothetical protein